MAKSHLKLVAPTEVKRRVSSPMHHPGGGSGEIYISRVGGREYRWFRSPNVICLEKARLLKGEPTS
jgi:hypothetical protein